MIRKSGQVSIADLTYREISMIFAYLDADTILTIYSSAQDIKSFDKVHGKNKCKCKVFKSLPILIAIYFSSPLR